MAAPGLQINVELLYIVHSLWLFTGCYKFVTSIGFLYMASDHIDLRYLQVIVANCRQWPKVLSWQVHLKSKLILQVMTWSMFTVV